MTATKKSIRFLTVLALIFAMVLSIASVPVSAANIGGTTTWYRGIYGTSEFQIHGYNLTPIKTIGDAGRLSFSQKFVLTDTSVNSNAARCTVEIKSTSGAVLARATGITDSDGVCEIGVPIISVSVGQKIQIYSTVYDVNTNYARKAKSWYSYILI